MSSVNQEDEFTEVTRKRKKRKASGSPTLLTLQKTGSSELPPKTPVHPRSSHKNTIPVIISGVDDKIKTWRQLMGELRQYHPGLKVSSIKALPKGARVDNSRVPDVKCRKVQKSTEKLCGSSKFDQIWLTSVNLEVATSWVKSFGIF